MRCLFSIVLLAVLATPARGQVAAPDEQKKPGEQCISRQDLLARAPGFLQKVYVADGSMVKKGDTIIELDNRLHATGHKEAKAGLDAAKANLALARDGYERIKKMKGSDSVSEQELFASKIRTEQAKAAFDQAEAVFERTGIQYEDTIIRAAVDGQVRGLPHVLGMYVQAGQSLGRIEVKGTNCQAVH